MALERFIATFDLHYGYERRSGHKAPLHDMKAWDVVMKFAQDFKPHHWVFGGDMLDCGVVSHHNHGKPGRTEGLRLLQDAEECKAAIVVPAFKLASKSATYIVGNHEHWLEDLTDDQPGLEGLVGLKPLLGLKEWNVIPQGGYHRIGKLHFIHGDQISGGTNAAKNAVDTYAQSIRLGHFHTFQAATKTSAIHHELGNVGMVVPCLCTKDPKYGQGKPNRWMQGFNFGYVDTHTGRFNDYVQIIVNGQSIIDGKLYKA